MLYSNLDAFLSIALTLSTFFIGIFVIIKFIHKRSQPIWLEITNHYLLICYLAWFAAYAISTRLELDAMKAVFDPKDLPGLNVSFAVLALAFSACFTLLIITHRNPFFSFPIIYALSFSDLFGNLSLISGMQYIAKQRISSGKSLSPAETVWFEYYLDNNHLIRIATYMLIVFIGFMVFLPSKTRYLRAEYLKETFHQRVQIKMAFFQKNWLRFEILSKLILSSAIIYNEWTMWKWRLAREVALLNLGSGNSSSYFGWSLIDAFK